MKQQKSESIKLPLNNSDYQNSEFSGQTKKGRKTNLSTIKPMSIIEQIRDDEDDQMQI